MKKYAKIGFALAAAVLTFIATIGVASACAVFFYQPEVPKALREE